MYYMIQKYSRWRVLRPFFDDPLSQSGFTLRHLSTAIGLAPTSVRLHLAELQRQGLILHAKSRPYPVYRANQDSERFRFYKRMDLLFRLEEIGLLDRLDVAAAPEAIILFGSASRGEDVAGSDIDLFLLASEIAPDLRKEEAALKRTVSLHFAERFSKLPSELRNSILNGIRLRGYVKVF